MTDYFSDALDARGELVNARYGTVLRPRILTLDEAGNLWVGGDGTAETPFGAGNGEISRIAPDGSAQTVLQGPLPASFSMSPGGSLFVVQRRTGQLFALMPDGRRLDFATTASGTFLRGLAFAPVTPETRRAGIAGDLFEIVPRLAQEIALLADRLDVSEETDRFRAHADAFRKTLEEATGAPAGKRLAFLLQEMLREVNTTGSKANDAAMLADVVSRHPAVPAARALVPGAGLVLVAALFALYASVLHPWRLNWGGHTRGAADGAAGRPAAAALRRVRWPWATSLGA